MCHPAGQVPPDLSFAVGMISGGRLGDLYGQRRLFTVGLALFTLTSAACGLAPTAGFRGRAFAAYGLAMGFAGVLGQLLGGALIQADIGGSSWRGIFLINLPVGLIALLLAGRVVPESHGQRARLDLTGTVLATLGLTAVVLPLVEGQQHHWPAAAWLSLAASPALLAGFAVHQRRRSSGGRAPLIEPGLFRDRAFGLGSLAGPTFALVPPGFFFVLALYLQEGRGFSALFSGVVFTAVGTGFFAAMLTAQAMTARLGRQTPGTCISIAATTLPGMSGSRPRRQRPWRTCWPVGRRRPAACARRTAAAARSFTSAAGRRAATARPDAPPVSEWPPTGEPGPLADPAAPHKLIAPALRPRRPLTRVRVIRGIPSAGPNRRMRRWRAAAVALAAVIVIVGAATARLFVWPPRGMPAHVDAIVMLNGQGNRLDTALWLAWNHRAPTVVISRGSPQWGHGSVCAPTIPGVKFICFVPNPETTRGEAEFAGELAKRYHWHSIALVTTTPQNTRARLRVGRCFSGKIYVVDAALPKYEWPYEIAYEWGATIKALLFQRSC